MSRQRAGGTGVAIIASAPVSVPVSTAVVVASAGIEVAVTGDESHAIDAIPGAGLRRLPGNVRTITNPDASPVERTFAGVDSVSSVLEAIPVFKAFKGLHGKTSNLRATPTTKPPAPESVTSKPTTPVEQADLQSSPQSSKICDSADVETATKESVETIFKAPQPGKGNELLNDGFDPSDFADGDKAAYFAKQRELAEQYARHYGDGVLEVDIPKRVYDSQIKPHEIPYLSDPSLTEIPVPHSAFDALNKAKRRLLDE